MSNKTENQSKYENADADIFCIAFYNCSSEVKYSEKTGFFIETFIYQRRVGRVWETLDDDSEFPEVPGATRRLITYRAISRDQAIRILLNNLDDLGGAITTISNALDAAGIEPLKEQL